MSRWVGVTASNIARAIGGTPAILGANTFTGDQTVTGSIVVSGSVTTSGSVRAATQFYFSSSTTMQAPSNGVLQIGNFANNAGVSLDVATDGTLKVRNRANNADAIFGGLQMNLTDGITAPGATVGFAKIYVDTADGDLKVIFGDGVTKVLAADT
jgi:hypothetical protein